MFFINTECRMLFINLGVVGKSGIYEERNNKTNQ
jgi:hypothetical protein